MCIRDRGANPDAGTGGDFGLSHLLGQAFLAQAGAKQLEHLIRPGKR